ncbi:MAG: hypothetical protein GQE15_33920 [Archangiaceae bacterium]|nr:hypothetical protein [Archangiaceae bacterium]
MLRRVVIIASLALVSLGLTVGEVPSRLSAAIDCFEAGPSGAVHHFFAPIVEVDARTCTRHCVAFRTEASELRVERTNGEALAVTEVDGELRFSFDDQTPFDVVLSWKPKRFDPGAVLVHGDCLSDGPPMPVRAGRAADGRAQLRLRLTAGTDEPALQ